MNMHVLTLFDRFDVLKNGLTALALGLRLATAHAAECADLSEATLQQLFDAQAIEPPYFTACGAWPGDASKRIVLLARQAIETVGKASPSDDGEGPYDLDIAVQDQHADGKAIMRLTQKGFVISDAISLRGLAVDGATYTLTPGTKAFAIRSSRANRYAEVHTLSMYAVHERQLVQVMGPMNVFTSFSQSADDASCFRTEATRSTIAVLKKKPSSSADCGGPDGDPALDTERAHTQQPNMQDGQQAGRTPVPPALQWPGLPYSRVIAGGLLMKRLAEASSISCGPHGFASSHG